MKASLLLVFCICWGVIHAQEIQFKTRSITNKKFLVASDWQGLDVDTENGEDLNSAKYGGAYFPPYRQAGDAEEARTTISRGFLLAEMDVINETTATWVVEFVEIVDLQEVFQVGLELERGEWDIGTDRTSDFVVSLTIPDKLKETVSEIFVEPSENYPDNRFLVEVLSSAGSEEKIYSFKLRCQLSNLDEADDTVTITSDKTFFLGDE